MGKPSRRYFVNTSFAIVSRAGRKQAYRVRRDHPGLELVGSRRFEEDSPRPPPDQQGILWRSRGRVFIMTEVDQEGQRQGVSFVLEPVLRGDHQLETLAR